MGSEPKASNLICSFCGKGQNQVRKLVAGPTVYICDECIDLCNDIIAEEYDLRGKVKSAFRRFFRRLKLMPLLYAFFFGVLLTYFCMR